MLMMAFMASSCRYRRQCERFSMASRLWTLIDTRFLLDSGREAFDH